MSKKISQKNKLALMQLASKVYTLNTGSGQPTIKHLAKNYKRLVKLFKGS